MKKFVIKVNGVSYNVEVEELDANAQFAAPAPVAVPAAAPAPAPVQAAAPAAPAAAPKPAASGAAGSVKITAPMPGTVIDVLVKPGQAVKKNETLCILEAMKMENEIVSPSDGTVVSVDTQKGSSVAAGDLMLTLA